MNRLQFLVLFIILCLSHGSFSQSSKTNETPGELKFDSTRISFQKMQGLNLPPMRLDSVNPLFNQCTYCQKENRPWYSSVDELCRSASVCGYDFIQIRFDQMFVQDNTALFMTVYCSALPGSITIDSVLYVRRNKLSSKETIFKTSIQSKKTRVLDLSGSEDKQNTISNDCPTVRKITEACESFCSTAEYSEQIDEFRYWFTLGDSVYCASEKELRSEPLNDMLKNRVQCSPVRIYYRLGIYSDVVNCFEREKPHKQSNMKINLKDHYIFNQCILDYEIESECGIKAIGLDAEGLINKRINFSGGKKISGSVPVGFGSKRKTLYISISDSDGNFVEKKIDIFGKIEQAQQEHEQLKNLRKAREAWSNKNGFTKAVNFASKFDGNNILTKLLDIYCEGQAKEYLLGIPDNFKRDEVKKVSLPFSGRVAVNESFFENIPTLYSYGFTVNAKQTDPRETIIFLTNKSSINSFGKHLSIRYEIPVGNGYYVPNFTVQERNTGSQTESVVMLGSRAEYLNGELQISDIPFVISEPVDNIEYSLAIHDTTNMKDSLLLTYVIECLDRTQIVLYRWGEYSEKETSENGFNEISGKEVEIRFKEKCISSEDKNVVVISQEEIQSKKKILGVNIFVYSKLKNRTIGAAPIWMEN